MAFERVQPGQPLRIPAADYNAMIDAARAHRLAGSGGPGQPDWRERDRGVVMLHNNSGGDFVRFGVVSVSEIRISPSDDIDQFKSRPVLAADTPAVADGDEARFAILLEPLPDGEVARGLVSGVTPVQVYVHHTGHRYADVRDGDAAKLETRAKGAARILWSDGTAAGGTGWAVVLLMDQPETIVGDGTWLGGTLDANDQVSDAEADVDDATGAKTLRHGDWDDANLTDVDFWAFGAMPGDAAAPSAGTAYVSLDVTPFRDQYDPRHHSRVEGLAGSEDTRYFAVVLNGVDTGTSHSLLGTTHDDTATQTVSRGSLIVGNATPAWDELAIATVSAGSLLTLIGGDGTDVKHYQLADGSGTPDAGKILVAFSESPAGTIVAQVDESDIQAAVANAWELAAEAKVHFKCTGSGTFTTTIDTNDWRDRLIGFYHDVDGSNDDAGKKTPSGYSAGEFEWEPGAAAEIAFKSAGGADSSVLLGTLDNASVYLRVDHAAGGKLEVEVVATGATEFCLSVVAHATSQRGTSGYTQVGDGH